MFILHNCFLWINRNYYFAKNFEFIKKNFAILFFLFLVLNSRSTENAYLKHINNLEFKGVDYISKDSNSFTIPFSLAGNLIIVRAKADNEDGNFILDSGCPTLVLNLTYFRDYPKTSESDDDTKGITGGIANVEHTYVKELTFGTKKEFNVNADIISLAHIENKRNIKVLGLIGMKFIDDTEMIIDYEKRLIYFHVIGKFETKNYKSKLLNDTSKFSPLPFDILDNRIVVKSEVGGKTLKLIIDCAAETNILNTKLPNSVFDKLLITGNITLLGAGSAKVEAIKGDLTDFKIGTKTINSLPFIVTNLDKTCFSYGGCIDGVLGFDFLGIQKVGFNFIKREMYIWK